tara:strand:- start:18850 stop:19794 length:945 start_codon:yes stop_codon:yes gene_type:complete
VIEIINDVEGNRKLIEETIKLYGSDPEQNYGYFISHQADDPKGDQCVYIRAGKYGILTTLDKESKYWIMIGQPIAPKKEQAELFKEVLDYLTQKKLFDKFVAEFEKEEKKTVDELISKSYKVHAPSCTLYWPIYDLNTWNGDELKGGDWKKLRYMTNNITKKHKVKIVDSVRVDKDELKKVVNKWKEQRKLTGFGINRKDSNFTDADQYIKLIDMEFTGCKFAKTVMINDKAASITAGWEVPNKTGAYYSGIGIYDYTIEYIGEYVNWSDLVMLKKAGYKEVDFGGSPKPLLQFKEKFKPSKIYTTHIYTVSRK